MKPNRLLIRMVHMLCLVAVVAGNVVYAQSIADREGDGIRDNLYGATLAGRGHFWVVGAFGSVLHSADEGRTWSRQTTPTTETLFSADMVDDDRGWVVGRAGLVLSTTDRGRSWRSQSSGTDKHLFDVDFADDQFGCAVGDWGAIVLTTDGGTTWRPYDLKEDVILNSVSLLDREHGWIAGEAGTLLATEDGGTTWERRDAGVEKTLFGVYFSNERNGWAVGIDALILATEDGGATWTVRHGSPEMSGLDQVAFAHAYENPSLYGIAVSGPIGIAVGDMGAILASADGGRTWTRRQVPAAWGLRWFASVVLDSEGNGMIVGAEGSRIAVRRGQLQVPGK